MTGRRHQSTGLSGRWLMVVAAMARDGMGWGGIGGQKVSFGNQDELFSVQKTAVSGNWDGN